MHFILSTSPVNILACVSGVSFHRGRMPPQVRTLVRLHACKPHGRAAHAATWRVTCGCMHKPTPATVVAWFFGLAGRATETMVATQNTTSWKHRWRHSIAAAVWSLSTLCLQQPLLHPARNQRRVPSVLSVCAEVLHVLMVNALV